MVWNFTFTVLIVVPWYIGQSKLSVICHVYSTVIGNIIQRNPKKRLVISSFGPNSRDFMNLLSESVIELNWIVIYHHPYLVKKWKPRLRINWSYPFKSGVPYFQRSMNFQIIFYLRKYVEKLALGDFCWIFSQIYKLCQYATSINALYTPNISTTFGRILLKSNAPPKSWHVF